MMHLVKVVLLFNVGVELGQIAIVAVIFPLIFRARRWRYYRPMVLSGASLLIAALAAWWFVQRAFEL